MLIPIKRDEQATRTVTGDKEAYLLGWDVWSYQDDNTPVGHYAVTPTTFASLREYFGLA